VGEAAGTLRHYIRRGTPANWLACDPPVVNKYLRNCVIFLRFIILVTFTFKTLPFKCLPSILVFNVFCFQAMSSYEITRRDARTDKKPIRRDGDKDH